MRLRLLSVIIVANLFALPSVAFATSVSVELTTVLLDDEQDATDLALLGILPKLEDAFPEARGYRLVESIRSDIASGSEQTLHLGSKAWRVAYLGDVGRHHKLEIESPVTLQTVRATSGSTFFFATRNTEFVVAVTVNRGPSRPATIPTKQPLPDSVGSNEEEGASVPWLLTTAVTVVALVFLVGLVRRLRE